MLYDFFHFLQVTGSIWTIVNMFKLYLTRLLRTEREASGSSPLTIFDSRLRTQVGKVLSLSSEIGRPRVYVPIFSKRYLQSYKSLDSSLAKVKDLYADVTCYYNICHIFIQDLLNERMQQPLSHLYFMCVLERLSDSERALSQLLECAMQLRRLCLGTQSDDDDKVLMWIELQAVMTCVAKQLAMHLKVYRHSTPQDLGGHLVELSPLLDSINE